MSLINVNKSGGFAVWQQRGIIAWKNYFSEMFSQVDS